MLAKTCLAYDDDTEKQILKIKQSKTKAPTNPK